VSTLIMVNTFVTSTSFQQSAADLATYHLNKQITEAYQIHRACETLRLLGEWYQQKVPTNPYDVWEWRKEVVRRYEKENYRLIYSRSKYVKVYPIKGGYPDMYTQHIYEKVVSETNDEITLLNLNTKKEKVVPVDTFVDLDELYLKKGYCYHAAILMWLHHLPALEYYINCCVIEYRRRGGNTRMKEYKVSADVEKPVWVFDRDFRRRNRSNLLRKEHEFKDKKWHQRLPRDQRYYYRDRFADHDQTESYFWPYSQNYDQAQRYSKT